MGCRIDGLDFSTSPSNKNEKMNAITVFFHCRMAGDAVREVETLKASDIFLHPSQNIPKNSWTIQHTEPTLRQLVKVKWPRRSKQFCTKDIQVFHLLK